MISYPPPAVTLFILNMSLSRTDYEGPYPLNPDEDFVSVVNRVLPYHSPTGGTDFLRDYLRHYYPRLPKENPLYKQMMYHEGDVFTLWESEYLEEVRAFLLANQIPDCHLVNLWFLNCRVWKILAEGQEQESHKKQHSKRLKTANIAKNQIKPFIKALIGDWDFAQGENIIKSITFKATDYKVPDLKLEGHFANVLFGKLQEVTDSYLKANGNFQPDLLTKRLRSAIVVAARGIHTVFVDRGLFTPVESQKTPPAKQLRVIIGFIGLAVANPEFLESLYPKSRSVEDTARRFFE